jgi:hypothetical protein
MGNKAFFLPLLLLPALAGCTRTSDGTVAIPHLIDARRIWDRGPTGTQTPPVQGSTVFPVAPVAERAERRTAPPAARHRKKKVRHAQEAGPADAPAAEPTKPIACGEARDLGARVRMVCQ